MSILPDIKEQYLKAEDFYSKKPILFWFITILITSLPLIGLWKYIIAYAKTSFIIEGYSIIGIGIGILFCFLFLLKFKRKSIPYIEEIKSLEAIRLKLENPFQVERVSFNGKTKYTEKFYHYEILECFSEYNIVVEKLKKANSNKFEDLNLRQKIETHKGDWVRENSMNVIKSDVIALLKRLK